MTQLQLNILAKLTNYKHDNTLYRLAISIMCKNNWYEISNYNQLKIIAAEINKLRSKNENNK